ncbi:GFA family protein [Sphingobium yanoikuyae]
MATCCCGALSMATIGEPIKISACHCRSCQKRTGSAFSVAVFFDRENARPRGPSEMFTRLGDSGLPVDFHFCPSCASTLFWYPKFRPAWVGVAIGCFDDHAFVPTQAVYEHERLEWAQIQLRSN